MLPFHNIPCFLTMMGRQNLITLFFQDNPVEIQERIIIFHD